MIDLHLIGIGTGSPNQLTQAAIGAMNAADVILLPRKGRDKADLIEVRRALCDVVLTGATRVVEFDMPVRDSGAVYRDAVDEWHAAIATVWASQININLPHGGTLALLVWGDPSLYDSTLRIADRLRASGLNLRVHVTPGITSLQALTAAHAIPVNALAAPVLITTGRELRRLGWPDAASSVAVMLDAGSAFEVLDPGGIQIWWGAYLGMAQQMLMAGALASIGRQIADQRAALRAQHGWIMDIYLMRKEKSYAHAR